MYRKLQVVALAAALSTVAGAVAAQDFVFSWNPRSGDVWVDTRLNDINDYGYRYREPFIDELVDYRDAPRDLVSDLLVRQRWAPGDVYYACTLAQIIGQPCRYVVDRWEGSHGQGWGVVAQQLGIKPGSPEFHRLKRGFVPSYDRWGRPIRLDDTLRSHFTDRGRGPGGIAIFDRSGTPGHGNSGRGKSGKGQDNGHGKAGARGKPGAQGKAGKQGDADKARGGGKGKSSGGHAKGNSKGSGKGNGKGKGH